jgi:hypothetical protein
MTLEQMIDAAYAASKTTLIGKKGAQLAPSFVVMFKNRPPAVLVAPWANDAEKDAFIRALKISMKLWRPDIIAYSAVSEAWVAMQDHAPRPGDRQPRDREDRKEVVFAVATNGTDQRFKAWEIIRGPDAVVTELVQRGDMDGLGGRMAELLDA